MESQSTCPHCHTTAVQPQDSPAGSEPCVNCGKPLNDGETPAQPAAGSAASVLTLMCKLCRSQVMIDPAKIGSTVQCPDCHSEIQVVASQPTSTKRKHWTLGNDHDLPSIVGNDDMKLSDPVNRPKIDYGVDPTWGLDPVTEDLLSTPLDPEVVDAEEVVDADDVEDTNAGSDSVDSEQQPQSGDATRRQQYDDIQQRLLIDDRKQLRRQALKDARQRDKENNRSWFGGGNQGAGQTGEQDKDTSRARVSRSKKRSKSRTTNGLAAALGKSFLPAALPGWLAGATCWAIGYAISKQFGSAAIVDGLLDPHQTGLPWRVVTAIALVMPGSLIVSWQCGSIFRNGCESSSPVADRKLGKSAFSDLLLFGLPWLVTGIPFLFFSSWTLPFQFLCLPPLLFAAWLNQSPWQFVAALTSPNVPFDQGQWQKVYQSVAVIAALAFVPAAMLHAGGILAVPGAILIVLLMTALARICGWHCRQLAKTLEPAA